MISLTSLSKLASEVLSPIFKYSMILAALFGMLLEPLTLMFNARCKTTNILLTTEYRVQFLACPISTAKVSTSPGVKIIFLT